MTCLAGCLENNKQLINLHINELSFQTQETVYISVYVTIHTYIITYMEGFISKFKRFPLVIPTIITILDLRDTMKNYFF